MMPERITSRQNPLLRHVKKLQSHREYRESCGEYVADGLKLLEEAAKWDSGLHTVIAEEGAALCPLADAVRVVFVPSDVMQSISMMKSPQGALFLCRIPPRRPLALPGGSLILDGIQDPGNLGTILRTADALEVPVVLSGDCADPYNPKVVRATMGALFRTPPQMADRETIVTHCAQQEVMLIATALTDTAVDIRELNLQKAAVIIGSEGQGISPEFLQTAQRQAIIPMNPRCESLNAALAATIVMWQMKR